MAKSAAARAEARVKQLCSLGLGAEAVMPTLLKEIGALVPSSGGVFCVADESGALANGYCDCSTPAMDRLYLEEVYCRREVGPTFPEAIRNEFGVCDSEEIMASLGSDMKAWRRSDHYDLIFRPRHHDFALRLVIREHRRARGIGLLYLYRELGERWFSSEEKRRLSGLTSFLALALAEPSRSEVPLADSGRRGLLIANVEGRLLDFSAEGRRLLFMATHPRVAPNTDFGDIDMLPAPLVQCCNKLDRIFCDDPAQSAPVYYCRNPWGAFTFHAQWLEGAGAGLIAITISHQEPVPIGLILRIKHLRLSARQAEVCFQMANGASIEQVAERLGISKHTAVSHGRRVYEELGVHSRTELMSKLLAAA